MSFDIKDLKDLLPDKFKDNISEKDKVSGCILWLGSKSTKGYVVFWFAGKECYAQNFIYEKIFGKISNDSVVKHTCGNRICCNPEHLKILSDEERFWSKVDKKGEDDCWNWTAMKNKKRYGNFTVNIRTIQVHRYSYELTYGKIPEGVNVCHKCDNKLCVNPKHLFLGTQKDNMEDMVKKGRSLKGEKNNSSKLTDKDIIEIIEMYKNKSIPVKTISQKYNVNYQTIREICRGLRWKHINSENIKIKRSKLDFEKVQQIRELYETKECSCKELSIMFNVHIKTISKIIHKKVRISD